MTNLFERKGAYAAVIASALLISFLIAAGAIHSRYQLAIGDAVKGNRSHANLLSSLIYEHENAAIGVLESFAQHSAFIDAVRSRDLDKVITHLQTLHTGYTEIDALFVTDRSGTLWANYPVDSKAFGKNLAYRDWYKGLSRNWKPYVSSVYRLIVLEKGMAVAVSVPVFDRRGSVIGTLSAAQRTPFLAAFVKANMIEPHKDITILDQEGNIIFSDVIPYEERITRYPDNSILEKALAGASADMETADLRRTGDISYASVAPVKALGWSVVVSQGRGEILRPRYGYFILCLVTSTVVFLLVAGGLLFFRREYIHRKTQELLKAEEKFTKTFRSNPAGVGLSRLSDGLVIEANEAMLKLLGYEKDEFVGHSLMALGVWNDLADRERMLQILMAEGRSVNQEYWLRTKSGELLLCNHSAELIEIGGEPHIIFTFFDITERKRMEEELRKSEEKSRLLIKYAPSMIYEVDFRGPRFISVNDAMCSILGYAREELMARNPLDLLESESRDLFQDRIRRHLAGEKLPELIEYAGRAKDGRIVHCLLNVSFTYEDGKPVGAVVIGHDITERKRMEEKVRESENELRLVMDTVSALISYIDRDFRYLRVNDSYRRWFGLLPQDIEGRHIRDVVGEAAWQIVLPRVQQALSGETVTYEERMPYQIGEERWVSSTFTPDRDAEGRVRGMVAHVSDITERKRAEEELAKAKERAEIDKKRLQDILEVQPNAVVIIDASSGKFTYLNKKALEIYGFDYHEMDLDWHIAKVKAFKSSGEPFPPDDLPINQALKYGRVVTNVDMTLLRGDGSRVALLVGAAPLNDSKGNIIAGIAVFSNITELKQAEEELKTYAARLEAAYKESESFSYSISHDLRAPLRAIDGFSMMLLKKHGDQFDEDSLRKFNVIRSNTQMMGKLIDDILSLSRLGRKRMSIELLDMDAIVHEVWQELYMDITNRNINLKFNGTPPGYGDRILIKQVYANLLGNAVKFTKFRDPALIEVGGHVHKDENVYYVKDNGAGFDMDYYDKLFGIFQRLHKPNEFEGTGVGLATIQRVIQRHGGGVWAEGKVDEGATFYFSLPSSHAIDGETTR